MPEQTGKETQISVTAFAYYKMGQVMADLHAHGLTLPTDELLDLSNYTLTAEGKAVLSPLGPMEKLVVLKPPQAQLTEEQIVAVLLPVAGALPLEL